ncbi:hypothetical protein O6H91_11G054000 [Diphasiastrum complanatum]|uniref:Uncharacterized protein n=1 Tax=Diphasiastrum complanatum TaxID=34168 RepID=A0ACC2C9A3_DIPCM|nr:hypothetical protein O6H91_11G054000 [Diphasiastrum complanatum]
MALRDVKQALQGKNVRSEEEEAILSRIREADMGGLAQQVKLYLSPLYARSGKENTSKAELHGLAKQFVPFLVRLLKDCAAALCEVPANDDDASQKRGDELFSVMRFSVNGLDCLRPWLVGCPFEIELQRYGLVRRFMAWKRYEAAFVECKGILRDVCAYISSSCKGGDRKEELKNLKVMYRKHSADLDVAERLSNRNRYKAAAILLPPPPEGTLPSLITLVVGVVVDLIVCNTETGARDASFSEKLADLVHQVEPWLRMMETKSAERQHELLFRALYCHSLIMIESARSKNPEHLRFCCTLTLHWCASCVQRDQYLKVARKIGSCLSSYGSQYEDIALDLLATSLSQVVNGKQRFGCTDHEVLETLESYARLCQTRKTYCQGWHHIVKIVQKAEQVCSASLIAVAGYYAIGLILLEKGSDPHKPNFLFAKLVKDDLGVLDASLLCQLLDNASVAVNQFFAREPVYKKESERISTKCLKETFPFGKILVTIYRALDYLRRNLTEHLQYNWNEFICNSRVDSIALDDDKAANFNSLLEISFCLLIKLIMEGNRYVQLGYDELQFLQKARHTVPAVALMALRLSLIRQCGNLDVVVALKSFISSTSTKAEELRWLMSSSYNIGVQMFNRGDYSLACVPLELASEASWTRIGVLKLEENFNTSEEVCESELAVSLAVSEACNKTSSLVDSLNRAGKNLLALEKLKYGFVNWAQVHGEKLNLESPEALIRLWVKMVLSHEEIVKTNFESQAACLYDILCNLEPALPMRTLGFLLEQELSINGDLERQNPSVLLDRKNRLLDILLDSVYDGKSFPLERSNILLEKCRLARIGGAESVQSCVTVLNEAVCVLTDALGDLREDSNDLLAAQLENQCAVAYCIRAFCSHEADPQSDAHLEDIFAAMELWRGFAKTSKALSKNGHTHPEENLSRTRFLCNASPRRIAIRLLLAACDLLALKGYSTLHIQVQEVALQVAAIGRMYSDEEICAELWAHNRVGHVFCCVPFTAQFGSLLKKHLGEKAISLSFWSNCGQLYPFCLLDTQQKYISQELLDCGDGINFQRKHDTVPTAIHSLRAIASSQVEKVPKTSQETLGLAAMLSMLSEYALERGDVIQALEDAKQSLKFCFKVLHNTFQRINTPSCDAASKSDASCSETSTKKAMTRFEAFGAVATVAWPSLKCSNDKEDRNPSQWRVLGDYLESLMQVGVLYERVGSVGEAERSFQEGLRLSFAQNLPLAEALFSSCLGELHRKKHLWSEAEHDFEKARQAFALLKANFACSFCMLVGTAHLELRIGDLARRFNSYGSQSKENDVDQQTFQADSPCEFSIISAMSHYDTAGSRLANLLGSLPTGICFNFHSHFEDGVEEYNKDVLMTHMRVDAQSEEELPCGNIRQGMHRPSRRGRSSRCSKADKLVTTSNIIISHKTEKALCDKMLKVSIRPKSNDPLSEEELICSDPCKKKPGRKRAVSARSNKASVPGAKGATKIKADISTSNAISDCDSILNAAIIQPNRIVMTSGTCSVLSERSQLASFSTILDWSCHKLEKCARRMMARILIQKDLYERNWSFHATEEAVILYHMSWLALWKRHVNARSSHCCLADDPGTRPLAWLRRAFHLCSEIPAVLKKVSSLLAILHIPKLNWATSMHPRCSISELQELGAFFHQLSVGTVVRQQQLMWLNSKMAALSMDNDTDSRCSRMKMYMNDMWESLRVKKSFEVHQSSLSKEIASTVCCISAVNKELDFLLEDGETRGVKDDTNIKTWLLISRWSEETLHIIHLPIVSFPGAQVHCAPRLSEERSSPYDLSETEDNDSLVKGIENSAKLEFRNVSYCGTLLNTLVAEFSSIMEESCLSTSSQMPITTTQEKALWWKWRMDLDCRLGSLLRKLEDSWLGPWKCLLLGQPSNIFLNRAFELRSKDLVRKLNSMAYGEGRDQVLVDKDIVKVLLQTVPFLENIQLEHGIARVFGWNGTSNLEIGQESCLEGPKSGVEPNVQIFLDKWQELIHQAALEFKIAYREAVKEASQMKESDGGQRKPRKQTRRASCKERENFPDFLDANMDDHECGRQPVVLVMDSKLQALPWESFPILRKQEVYRMPSFGSISALVVHLSHIAQSKASMQEHVVIESSRLCTKRMDMRAPAKHVEGFHLQDIVRPYINPHNAYYLLNPGGDLGTTQAAFESWFKDQKGWEGRAGEAPSSAEYMKALQEHDLFVYLGHGSGEQYFPERLLRKLDQCAAALLMGCSSGKLCPRGDYEPTGVPFSYLMAGCPAAIANLWDVTDGDIDRFSRTILHKWLGVCVEEFTSNSGEDIKTNSVHPPGSMNSRVVSSKARIARRNRDRNIVEDELPVSHPSSLYSSQNSNSFLSGENNIGSTLEAGRSSCRLPYLIGASPVCYGVPVALLSKAPSFEVD